MTEPKKRGRPRLSECQRRRRNQVFRVRDDLRDRLASLARTNQRSISEEIEHRLEMSFIAEDAFKVARLISDPDAAAMIEKAAALWPGEGV